MQTNMLKIPSGRRFGDLPVYTNAHQYVQNTVRQTFWRPSCINKCRPICSKYRQADCVLRMLAGRCFGSQRRGLRPPLSYEALALRAPCPTKPLPYEAPALRGPCPTRPLPYEALALRGPCLTRPLPDEALALRGTCPTKPQPDEAPARRAPSPTKPLPDEAPSPTRHQPDEARRCSLHNKLLGNCAHRGPHPSRPAH